MSNLKKRSRFAKSSEEIATTATEFDAFSDDYLAPLEQLINTNPNTLTSNKSHEETSQKKSKPSLQTLMDESREKSMAIPISSNNIGFKMLKNFGYNEGEGLGKDGKGLVEPITVQKRNNKDMTGLGVTEKRERVQKTLESIKYQKLSQQKQQQNDFVSNKVNQQKAARYIGDMKKAQKVIYELDEQAGISIHELTASLHLRYTAFSSSKTVDAVLSESVHRINNDEVYDRYSGSDVIDTALEDDIPSQNATLASTRTTPTDPVEPSLEDCLCYLREVHFYCYYCGAGYDDTDDLLNSCPGLFEDDH